MSSTEAAVIDVSRLTKRYGDIRALDSVTLSVPGGIVFGFLGPNGAGKTTTIRILMGFMKPTAGTANVLGFDAWREGVEARKRVGYLVPSSGLYQDLSGIDQLDFAARISDGEPHWRGRMLDALELSDRDLKRTLHTYSRGMRQKLALVAAAQHGPDLLVLDEPTEGIDPLVQRNFEVLLREFTDAGMTVFMSSHDLGEVERACDEVAVVRKGTVIATGTVDELKERYSQKVEVVFADGVPDRLASVPGIEIASQNHRLVTLTLERGINPLLAFLAGQNVERMEIRPPELQEVFLGFYAQQDDRTETSVEAETT
jgi:ABC-2 type transport system ATP-binding protein